MQVSAPVKPAENGYVSVDTAQHSSFEITFSLPVRLLAPHPATGQDTLTVSRGPIIYTAESIDNTALGKANNHFEGVGIGSNTKLKEGKLKIEGIDMMTLSTEPGSVYVLEGLDSSKPFKEVNAGSPARTWKKVNDQLVFVPWFARANRGGAGHVRTSFIRADEAVKH